MSADSRPRALVVFVHYSETLSYFDDWLDAFKTSRQLDIVPANLATPLGRLRLRRSAGECDLVVLLHSVVGDSLTEVQRWGTPLLERRGPLVAFVGNEVSLPTQPIAAKLEVLRWLSPQFVATQLPLDAGEYLYEGMGAQVLALPHALNPQVFHPHGANELRSIDIGFRGSRYPPHVGDDDRNRIIDYFSTISVDPPLAIDIRINTSQHGRRAWAGFLNRCKATIGTESGGIELRRDDAILGRTEAVVGVTPSESRTRALLRPVHRHVPRIVKSPLRRVGALVTRRGSAPTAPGAQPWRITTTADGVSGKGISSRHFDAIGTETCQILFPGRYNDILEADRHYLCLQADFSNIDDVLARFRDDRLRGELVRETREWALSEHTYQHRVATLVDAVSASAQPPRAHL